MAERADQPHKPMFRYGFNVSYETGQEFTFWFQNEYDRDYAAHDAETQGGYVTCSERVYSIMEIDT